FFGFCEGFLPGADLLEWMRRHRQAPIAAYVNTIGRTVRQIREEAALHDALSAYVGAPARALAIREPRALHRDVVDYLIAQQKAGALTLCDPEPTPLGWRHRNTAHAVAGLLVAFGLTPLLLLYL